ncbi:MAG: hypothetical protein PHO66_01135 [Eubacteriales bacterium]|nr:hypothetical protein [Eubacteriales bacterium]
MPEIPEIWSLADQMRQTITGKTVATIDIGNEKALNLPPDAFAAAIAGLTIDDVTSHGKWIIWRCTGGARLLLNLNMGGEAVYYAALGAPRDGWRLQLHFTDGSRLSIGFWWLGFFHYVPPDGTHAAVDALGLDIFDPAFTAQWLYDGLHKRKKPVKAMLLDQRFVAGLGNYYAHDIFFLAGIHPLRPANAISAEQCTRLHRVMLSRLRAAAAVRGAAYERDLFDQSGGFADDIIGYKQGQPCPVCGGIIEKIKTGATSGYVCPGCQR